ncbi:MAG TPA: hypothetical protein GXZ90_01760, partial [Clostridiales bacterium]|nr:hypothetical protein [Clostridiales bacterium]
DVIKSPIGTGSGLSLKNTVAAGKTGTTSNKKDGWFVGYTPYYTTSVWVGYDIPKTLDNLRGASYPAYIWKEFMDQIHDESMSQKFRVFDWIKEKKENEEVEDEYLDIDDIDDENIDENNGEDELDEIINDIVDEIPEDGEIEIDDELWEDEDELDEDLWDEDDDWSNWDEEYEVIDEENP